MSYRSPREDLGIDTKNRVCQVGCTNSVVGEGVGVRYGDDERDHSVKCWNHPG